MKRQKRASPHQGLRTSPSSEGVKTRGANKRGVNRADSGEPTSKVIKMGSIDFVPDIPNIRRWVKVTMKVRDSPYNQMIMYVFMPNYGPNPATNSRKANFSDWYTAYTYVFPQEVYEECTRIASPILRFNQLSPGPGVWVQDELGHFYMYIKEVPELKKDSWVYSPLRRPQLEDPKDVLKANNAFVNKHFGVLANTPAVVLARAWWYYVTLGIKYLQAANEKPADADYTERMCCKVMHDYIRNLVIKKIKTGKMHDGHFPPFPKDGSIDIIRQWRWSLLRLLSTMVYLYDRRSTVNQIRDLVNESGIRLNQNIPVPGMLNCPPNTLCTSAGWYMWTNTAWTEPTPTAEQQQEGSVIFYRQDNYNPVHNAATAPEVWDQEAFSKPVKDLTTAERIVMGQTLLNPISPFCPEFTCEAVTLPAFCPPISTDGPNDTQSKLKKYWVTPKNLGMHSEGRASWVLPLGHKDALGKYPLLVPNNRITSAAGVSDDVSAPYRAGGKIRFPIRCRRRLSLRRKRRR